MTAMSDDLIPAEPATPTPPVAPAPPPVPTGRSAAEVHAASVRRNIGLAAVVAVVVVAAVVGLWWIPSHQKMTVHGTFTMTDPTLVSADCVGSGGYADIGPTTQVSITADGKVVAFAYLGDGTANATVDECEWHWTATGVPKGKSVYIVEVARRGGVNFTEAQMAGGEAETTLTGS